MGKRTVLFITALIILLASASPLLAGPLQRKQILDASVVITMKVPASQAEPTVVDEGLPIPRDDYQPVGVANSYVVAEGLGTVIRQDGKTFIVTHDHWSVLDHSRGTVQIGDATGDTLLELSLPDFKSHVVYRDGGTMLLEAPAELPTRHHALLSGITGLVPAGDPGAGDTVLVSRRGSEVEGEITIMEATVESTGQKAGQATMRLRSQENEIIVGGDSGGGIWSGGRLVGNMWTTIMMEARDTGQRRATSASIAASYPPEAISVVAALDPITTSS